MEIEEKNARTKPRVNARKSMRALDLSLLERSGFREVAASPAAIRKRCAKVRLGHGV
jgi:hypothetical protein